MNGSRKYKFIFSRGYEQSIARENSIHCLKNPQIKIHTVTVEQAYEMRKKSALAKYASSSLLILSLNLIHTCKPNNG